MGATHPVYLISPGSPFWYNETSEYQTTYQDLYLPDNFNGHSLNNSLICCKYQEIIADTFAGRSSVLVLLNYSHSGGAQLFLFRGCSTIPIQWDEALRSHSHP